MSNIPLFSEFSSDDLEYISCRGVVKKFSKNTVLINEGDRSDALYVIRQTAVPGGFSHSNPYQQSFYGQQVNPMFGHQYPQIAPSRRGSARPRIGCTRPRIPSR